MGCSSSIGVVEVEKQEHEKEDFNFKTNEQCFDKTSDYSSWANVKDVEVEENDKHRIQSSMPEPNRLQVPQITGYYQQSSVPVTCTPLITRNSPGTIVRMQESKVTIIDSPAPFRKISTSVSSDSFPEEENWKKDCLMPTSKKRHISVSMLSSPLDGVKEGLETDLRGDVFTMDTESDKDDKSANESKPADDDEQALLQKALIELSKSLSDTHGSTLHLNAEENDAQRGPSPMLLKHPTNAGGISDTYCNLVEGVVVMDIGSGFCKAGISHDDVPSVVIPTLVGRPKNTDSLPGLGMETTFVGNDVKLRSDALTLSTPVQRGIVENWDDWSAVVDHVINLELKMEMDEVAAVLPESSVSTRESREKKAELMFEKFQIPKLYQGSKAPMALHAFGMTSGFLVSVGHGITSCVPVIQGNVQVKGIKNLFLGGYDITKKLQQMMETNGGNGLNNDESIAKAMMERLCYVATDSSENDVRTKKMHKSYSLPSGTSVSLDRERFIAPEILFNPRIIKDDVIGYQALHEMCVEGIEACRDEHNDDVIKSLYKNIVLVGGASLLPGLPKRLKQEVLAFSPNLSDENVCVNAFPKRQYAVWRGAAHMTSLQLSRSRWITKAEYDEHGSTIVNRKYV